MLIMNVVSYFVVYIEHMINHHDHHDNKQLVSYINKLPNSHIKCHICYYVTFLQNIFILNFSTKNGRI